MKKKFVLKTLLSLFVAFAIAFGAFQIFFDSAEAGTWSCGKTAGCYPGGSCEGGTLQCYCNGGPAIYWCWVAPVY